MVFTQKSDVIVLNSSSVETQYTDLKAAVDHLVTADGAWFDLLNNTTEDIQEKIKFLKAVDEYIFTSFSKPSSEVFPPGQSEEDKRDILGGFVAQLEGYKKLTWQYFSELFALVGASQKKSDVQNSLKALFYKLSEVEQWLFEEETVIVPSEFDDCTDLFLTYLKQVENNDPSSPILKNTKQLFRNNQFRLTHDELEALINAWGKTIVKFIEDAEKTNINDPNDELKIGDHKTIADFLCMHDRLETLYLRLETNVSLI